MIEDLHRHVESIDRANLPYHEQTSIILYHVQTLISHFAWATKMFLSIFSKSINALNTMLNY